MKADNDWPMSVLDAPFNPYDHNSTHLTQKRRQERLFTIRKVITSLTNFDFITNGKQRPQCVGGGCLSLFFVYVRKKRLTRWFHHLHRQITSSNIASYFFTVTFELNLN